ncbi:MAG: thioredoxin domain-containing protein [Chitinophagales bacterium]
MKRIILLLITLISLAVQAQGIAFFKGTFDEAKAEAKKEGKLIFMDAYATWCGPCKRMARDVFPTKEAGEYFNANFVNVKMDMEKGEGRGLAKKYGVRSYPTLLFIDYNGDVVYETKGARRNAASLIEVGKRALKPSKSKLVLLDGQFEEGNREISFLKEYITAKNAFGQNTDDAMAALIISMSADEKQEIANQKFIYTNTQSVNSAGVAFINSNKASLIKEIGKENFDKKMNTIALETASKAAKEKNVENLVAAKAFLKQMKPKDFKRQVSFIDTKYYGMAKDWNNYDKAVSKYLKKYKKNDDEAYNAVAWNYYMNIDDNNKLAKAEKWMQKAVEINNSYSNNLTQSYLLYKMERYSEAQDAVEYALILSKDSAKNTKNAEILKSKIETALKAGKKEVVIDYKVK